jgi:uncharacterized coiled-coil DUF342 family protein
MEVKKQYNSLRYETSEEIAQLTARYNEKNQEVKKLKDNILVLHEENQEFKQKESNYTKAIDQCNQEIMQLKTSLESAAGEL